MLYSQPGHWNNKGRRPCLGMKDPMFESPNGYKNLKTFSRAQSNHKRHHFMKQISNMTVIKMAQIRIEYNNRIQIHIYWHHLHYLNMKHTFTSKHSNRYQRLLTVDCFLNTMHHGKIATIAKSIFCG